MQELELLCPAKDLELGKLAINYGADAVYIGASSFSARASAANNLADIEALCTYAHKYRAKTYVALNTILYNNELADAEKLIRQLYNAGADALIIQDLGILQMSLPAIPLFASTQTHNYDIERIKFLDKVGFSRIILARELALNEIKLIRNETSTELEAFVHGALCVSLSGQCYASQATTDRSANRGACSQVCRMPFDLVSATGDPIIEDRHFLSLKDFNASKHIHNLVNAGITSFKIEGRLKDKTYLINNTAFYRTIIDRVLMAESDYKRASSGKTVFTFEPDPEKSFNRGYTNYFAEGRSEQMASFDTPKSMGKFVGTVHSVHKNKLVLQTQEKISNGDGLCYIDKSGSLQGFNVNRAEGQTLFLAQDISIDKGCNIYRNFDKSFVDAIERNSDKRRVSLSFNLSKTADGIVLQACDEDGISVEFKESDAFEPAENAERALDTIHKQLSKSGDTMFAVDHIAVDLEQPLFIPASKLNAMRRKILVQLETEREKAYERKPSKLINSSVPYFQTELDYMANVSNDYAQKFYTSHGVNAIDQAFELLPSTNTKGKVVMTTRYCIKFELGVCPHKQTISAKGKAFNQTLYLQDKKNKYRLQFNCKACQMQLIYE